MRLSDDIKARIQAEYDAWFESQYAGKDKAERQKLAQFFTPPVLSIRMLEKFETVEDKDILDPTLGAGGLIAAAVIAGADPSRCYGIELDPAVLEVAKRRLARLGVPPQNLRQGDALDPKSYEFDRRPAPKTFAVLYKQDKAVVVLIVKNGKLLKEVRYTDKAKLKVLVSKLLEKKIQVTKI